jgi:hypothetical protein
VKIKSKLDRKPIADNHGLLGSDINSLSTGVGGPARIGASSRVFAGRKRIAGTSPLLNLFQAATKSNRLSVKVSAPVGQIDEKSTTPPMGVVCRHKKKIAPMG